MKKILLISNRVMHYRVPVYNYFHERFRDLGWELIVRANELQKQNTHPIDFDFKEIAFDFALYKEEINRLRPDTIIIFLHLKDRIIWPLLFWLKIKRIPVIFWTKGGNLDQPKNKLKYLLFNTVHSLADGLILYSKNEMDHIMPLNRHKKSAAHNTVNFASFPEICESKNEIKKEFGITFEKVVLSVGRMNSDGGRKKIDHLIEIFRDVAMEGVGLVIVGSGINDRLRNMMNPKNILYLGEVHDPRHIKISKIYKMADVFSIPGHIGLGINQAFYWGLPVVTEAGLQPPEIHYLIDGRNGFIVPENDLAALKEKIFYLLSNHEVRMEFSNNARADILKHASIEGMFQGFREAVEKVAK